MAQLGGTFLLMRLQKGLWHDVLDKMERVEGNILTDNHLESFTYSSLLSYRVWTLRGAGNNFTFTQCAVYRRDSDRKKPATLSETVLCAQLLACWWPQVHRGRSLHEGDHHSLNGGLIHEVDNKRLEGSVVARG